MTLGDPVGVAGDEHRTDPPAVRVYRRPVSRLEVRIGNAITALAIVAAALYLALTL